MKLLKFFMVREHRKAANTARNFEKKGMGSDLPVTKFNRLKLKELIF